MAWTIEIDPRAQRQFRKLDPTVAKRIRRFLGDRVGERDDPRQIGEALEGSELGHLWRYRVGDYRVICDIQDQRVVVLVLSVGHRGDIYR